jgi:hypothetical protein
MRRKELMMLTATDKNYRPALIGAILILPTALFVLVGSSKFWALGNPFYNALDAFSMQREAWQIFNIVSPIIFLGGSALALIINILPLVQVKIHKEQSDWVGTLRLRANALNLGVVAASLGLLLALITYAIVENFQCIIGQKLSC